MLVPVMEIRPVGVGVGEGLVLVGMRVFHSGRKIGMRMGVVSIVMAMPVLMGERGMRMHVFMALPEKEI